jgi:hypothetical protein
MGMNGSIMLRWCSEPGWSSRYIECILSHRRSGERGWNGTFAVREICLSEIACPEILHMARFTGRIAEYCASKTKLIDPTSMAGWRQMTVSSCYQQFLTSGTPVGCAPTTSGSQASYYKVCRPNRAGSGLISLGHIVYMYTCLVIQLMNQWDQNTNKNMWHSPVYPAP